LFFHRKVNAGITGAAGINDTSAATSVDHCSWPVRSHKAPNAISGTDLSPKCVSSPSSRRRTARIMPGTTKSNAVDASSYLPMFDVKMRSGTARKSPESRRSSDFAHRPGAASRSPGVAHTRYSSREKNLPQCIAISSGRSNSRPCPQGTIRRQALLRAGITAAC
jgi:hypothetical protein